MSFTGSSGSASTERQAPAVIMTTSGCQNAMSNVRNAVINDRMLCSRDYYGRTGGCQVSKTLISFTVLVEDMSGSGVAITLRVSVSRWCSGVHVRLLVLVVLPY